jgi:Peptidase family M23
MTGRSAAIKGLIGVVVAASLTSALPRSASAQSSPWWPGDPEVILGYGCTSVELEPYDSRFACPASASHVHEGMDIDLPYGTPIYAGWPGIVTEVGGRESHDYGPHYVKIWLDEGHDILLGHLSKATVVPHQRVEIGTLVGYVGDLGVTDIPNLDFGARPHGGGEYQSIDPSPFLAFLDRSQSSETYAARDQLGRIQVLARSAMDGSAWSTDLTGAWTPTLDGPYEGFATGPVVTGDGRGHLVAFGVGVDGALWTSSQLTRLDATTRWRAWTSLGHPSKAGSGLVGVPAAGLDPSGRLHVVVRAADGALWEVQQIRAGGRWSAWPHSPIAGQIASDPVVARDSSGSLRVFTSSTDGTILVNREAKGSGTWTGWRSLGRPTGDTIGISDTSVLRDGVGRLEAFVVTVTGSIFTSTQISAARWTPWSQIGRASNSMAAVLRSDRRVQVFALNGGDLTTTIRQGNTWSSWITLGHGLSGQIATSFGPGDSLLVLAGTDEDAVMVRSGDPQWFDHISRGGLAPVFARLQESAWTALPGLPHVVNRGRRGGPF